MDRPWAQGLLDFQRAVQPRLPAAALALAPRGLVHYHHLRPASTTSLSKAPLKSGKGDGTFLEARAGEGAVAGPLSPPAPRRIISEHRWELGSDEIALQEPEAWAPSSQQPQPSRLSLLCATGPHSAHIGPSAFTCSSAPRAERKSRGVGAPSKIEASTVRKGGNIPENIPENIPVQRWRTPMSPSSPRRTM